MELMSVEPRLGILTIRHPRELTQRMANVTFGECIEIAE
jgi:hypothetical protein